MAEVKDFIKRNNHWITVINTLLIVIGIALGVAQRLSIGKKSLKNQKVMMKSDSERVKVQDSVNLQLRHKLDSINNKSQTRKRQ